MQLGLEGLGNLFVGDGLGRAHGKAGRTVGVVEDEFLLENLEINFGFLNFWNF